MAEDAVLEVNLLEFRLKSYSFDRCARAAGTEYALFHRTETESETQFRPRLVTLRVALPRDWVVYDADADVLRIARHGGPTGPRSSGTALEDAAEKAEFDEQGVHWRRRPIGVREVLYFPDELAASLEGDGPLVELGLRTA
jgi:hypothetical protein